MSRSEGVEPEVHRGGASCDRHLRRTFQYKNQKNPSLSEFLLVAEHYTEKNYEIKNNVGTLEYP